MKPYLLGADGRAYRPVRWRPHETDTWLDAASRPPMLDNPLEEYRDVKPENMGTYVGPAPKDAEELRQRPTYIKDSEEKFTRYWELPDDM